MESKAWCLPAQAGMRPQWEGGPVWTMDVLWGCGDVGAAEKGGL